MRFRIHHQAFRFQAGFSLTELMIAVALGLALLAGLTGLFVTNSKAREEIEKTNRQIENGRYATQIISEDLRLAGFYGEFDPTNLTAPGAKPDPCSTTLADLRTALPLHVQGYDNDGAAPALSCLTDVAADTDILVVRHASTCTAGAANCDAVTTNTPYFQASLCNSAAELDSADPTDHFALDTDVSQLIKTQRNCATVAGLRRYRVHIYFIANNDESGDGIKTLKRAELGPGGFTIVPLVEGVENLQIEYGMDTTASPGDGSPDVYHADPDSYNACAAAACVTNWRNVMSLKVNLLARNNEATAGYTDTKTYTLGNKADGTANTVGPHNDRIKRHVYQTVIRLPNPAGRREL